MKGMAEEHAAEPGGRREEADIGRSDTGGPQVISEGPPEQDPRDAAAKNGHDSAGAGGEEPASKKTSGGEFYKSQEEVDRAFGYRLASERRRWEREHRDELRRVRSEAPEDGQTDARLSGERTDGDDYAYFADLVAQGNELAGVYPAFDLMEEIGNNPAFERMVANGVPVPEAYEMAGQAPLLEKERMIRQDERRRIMEEMESRAQSLPPVEQDPGLSDPVLDVTRISEEELKRLAERVRRGERVVI